MHKQGMENQIGQQKRGQRSSLSVHGCLTAAAFGLEAERYLPTLVERFGLALAATLLTQ